MNITVKDTINTEIAEIDEEYLRNEEEKNQNTACGASCWRSTVGIMKGGEEVE